VLSLVERKTGYLVLGHLRRRTSAEVNRRAWDLILAQPRPVRTITVDNGTEFHEYAALERATARSRRSSIVGRANASATGLRRNAMCDRPRRLTRYRGERCTSKLRLNRFLLPTS